MADGVDNQMLNAEMQRQQNSGEAPAQGNSPPALDFAYDRLREARGRMDTIQNVLGGLVKMGDMVTQEDVIKAASKIVASGVDAKGMAAMLADMPEKGELIAPWLAQHAQQINAKEQQLNEVLGSVQHHMGVQAVRQLMQQGPAADASGMGTQENALAAQAGGSGPQNPLMMEQ